ncbi:hypothetical protein RUMHYD_00848 [Blautia hydrogenotrophica DSM 10507]|uniref:Uncharacterized protein n=1 Tax=Blautia hydrogenotrophica (strain DSM 10507 / JCM 14656 / S5a33) TaxID=476272 RepID=C0CJ31_BLAHS|nr:hypothetical protein RUMHYD_00848 [Blautia hydrogenotrophica DSM 10507]
MSILILCAKETYGILIVTVQPHMRRYKLRSSESELLWLNTYY